MTDSKQLVGKYEIERLLGEGGFGIVYKANDTTLDRAVALKQLRAELSSSPQSLERFKHESRSMGALNQTNIIKVLEVFEDSGRYFIAMDYMPNGSLADKLKGGTPLSVEKTVEILKPIARALDYAHKKNLIHRDIKPSNILFTEEDDPVLSDFGLVKSLVNQGLTTTGSTFGTPEYMAPEQILCQELTPAADLYALGVVAYQMLTGSVPFQGNTPFEIQEGHVHTPPPDILATNKALPAEYTGVFAKILAKNPQERYTTAREFIQELSTKENFNKQERNFGKGDEPKKVQLPPSIVIHKLPQEKLAAKFSYQTLIGWIMIVGGFIFVSMGFKFGNLFIIFLGIVIFVVALVVLINSRKSKN